MYMAFYPKSTLSTGKHRSTVRFNRNFCFAKFSGMYSKGSYVSVNLFYLFKKRTLIHKNYCLKKAIFSQTKHKDKIQKREVTCTHPAHAENTEKPILPQSSSVSGHCLPLCLTSLLSHFLTASFSYFLTSSQLNTLTTSFPHCLTSPLPNILIAQ